MVNSLKLMALAGIVVVVVAACSANGSKTFKDTRVLSVGSDEPTKLCADFNLTSKQAQQFLNRAQPITAPQMHDHYSYLPCCVKGKVVRVGEAQQSCDFTIRAGGTAELSCDDGQGYLYGCDGCEELLADNPPATR